MWLSRESGRYFFFGGDLPENRVFWFSAEMFPDFFQLMPRRTVLYDINKDSAEGILRLYPQYTEHLKPSEKRYYLNLEKIGYDLGKYFASFSAKHRKNLFYDVRKLAESGVDLHWGDSIRSLDDMFRLSKERFAENSDFLDEKALQQFRSFIEYLKREGLLIILTAEVAGKIVGIEVAAIYKNTYYVLNGGFDKNYSNVGKLLILEQIKKADAERCQEIDFLVGDTGWKELWNLDREPVFTLDKEDLSDEALRLLANL